MTANGSRRWFGYESDSGVNFAVELDESTYESANLGFPAVAAGAIAMRATGTIPLQMRRVNCSRIVNDETLRASFYVGTRAALDTIISTLNTITVGGDAWQVQSAVGEVYKVIPATDTAQLDGDIDNNLAV
jgi:hypothetical protein